MLEADILGNIGLLVESSLRGLIPISYWRAASVFSANFCKESK